MYTSEGKQIGSWGQSMLGSFGQKEGHEGFGDGRGFGSFGHGFGPFHGGGSYLLKDFGAISNTLRNLFN